MDTLKDWIGTLQSSDTLILVEGDKDQRALEHFGISNILTLKKPLYAVVEDIASQTRECILLTDLDKKGKELFGRITKDLRKHGVFVGTTFREFLFKQTQLRQIEGLTSYFHKIYKLPDTH